MAGELVTAGESRLAPRSERPLIMAEVLQVEAEQRSLLMQYIQAHMVLGTDYGAIPGTDKNKKVLLKPGAEKLTDLFRCFPEYEIVERIEDWDRPLFYYLFRCRIKTRELDAIVAEGYGSCSSRESKYRWRNEARKCPACGAAAIIKGKAEFGGGWLCWDKKGGCKGKWPDGAPEIEKQAVGKVENEDVADAANTILKMAKKRAQVDAVIALARCSDMFTQDIGDDGDEEPRASTPQASSQPSQRSIDRDSFQRELARTGWTWAGVVAEINRVNGKSYPADSKLQQIDPTLLSGFFGYLQTLPDKGGKQSSDPTSTQPPTQSTKPTGNGNSQGGKPNGNSFRDPGDAGAYACQVCGKPPFECTC